MPFNFIDGSLCYRSFLVDVVSVHFPSPLTEETSLSHILSSSLINKLTIYAWVYFCNLYSDQQVCFDANTILFWVLTLYYTLKSGTVMPSTFTVPSQVCFGLAIQGLLWVRSIFRIVFSISVKHSIGILHQMCISLGGVLYECFNNINSSGPWAWYIIPLIGIFLNLFH